MKKVAFEDEDISIKIASIQCSWVQKLFEEEFYDWKVLNKIWFLILFKNIFKTISI